MSTCAVGQEEVGLIRVDVFEVSAHVKRPLVIEMNAEPMAHLVAQVVTSVRETPIIRNKLKEGRANSGMHCENRLCGDITSPGSNSAKYAWLLRRQLTAAAQAENYLSVAAGLQ